MNRPAIPDEFSWITQASGWVAAIISCTVPFSLALPPAPARPVGGHFLGGRGGGQVGLHFGLPEGQDEQVGGASDHDGGVTELLQVRVVAVGAGHGQAGDEGQEDQTVGQHGVSFGWLA